MKRIAISIILLLTVLVMGQTVFAGDGQINTLRITISPVMGDVGTVVEVLGTGANPDFDVVITLAPQSDSADGAFASTTVSPTDEGAFEATLTIPDDIDEGRYFLRAEQFADSGNVLQYYWNGFTVGAVADASLLPETGTLPGTPFTITASLGLLLAASLVLRGIYAVVFKR